MPRKRHPIKYSADGEPSRKERYKLKPSYLRSKARLAARAKFSAAIAKERAIGVDPIYRHGRYYDMDGVRKAWKASEAAYLASI